MPNPSRGDVWFADLNPTRGREQAGRRPVLVISVDPFNRGAAGLVVVLPLTSWARENPLHVEVVPPEAGVRVRCFIKCEDARSVAKHRLLQPWGAVSSATLAAVEDRLRMLLGL